MPEQHGAGTALAVPGALVCAGNGRVCHCAFHRRRLQRDLRKRYRWSRVSRPSRWLSSLVDRGHPGTASTRICAGARRRGSRSTPERRGRRSRRDLGGRVVEIPAAVRSRFSRVNQSQHSSGRRHTCLHPCVGRVSLGGEPCNGQSGLGVDHSRQSPVPVRGHGCRAVG